MVHTSLHQALVRLRDPRMERCKKHKLPDIIIMSILAVLSGAESYDSIELLTLRILLFSSSVLNSKTVFLPTILLIAYFSLLTLINSSAVLLHGHKDL